MAKGELSVSVSGLSKLQNIPEGLEKAQREFLENAAEKIAKEVGQAAPHGRGRLAASWKSQTISDTKARVYSKLEYAKAQDRGAYITPKSRRVLRFVIHGKEHFARAVRLKGKDYVKKGLRNRGRIIRAEYDKAFDNLGI